MMKKIVFPSQKIIGILAGMGPKSTAPFIEKVIAQCQIQYGAKDDIDFPPMMIYSLPTPFYVDRPLDHQKIKRIVSQGLAALESMGVSFIAIPCNTVHAYYDSLQKSISIPLLNIVEETLRDVPAQSRVTVLGTKTTHASNIYQQGIQKVNSTFVFKEEWQEQVNTLITLSKEGKNVISLWKKLLAQFKKERIEVIILACTDLSLLPKSGFRVIDSSEELAKAVVRRYCNHDQ